MANHYLKASFVIDVASAEADLIGRAFTAAGLLGADPDAADAALDYAALGPAFAAAFPATTGDPFARFRDLFDDRDHPTFGCTMERLEDLAVGCTRLWFAGDQVGIDALPRLFAKAVPSALPFAFGYSLDCDRLRIGEFGGGVAIATAAGVRWISTRELVESAIAPAP